MARSAEGVLAFHRELFSVIASTSPLVIASEAKQSHSCMDNRLFRYVVPRNDEKQDGDKCPMVKNLLCYKTYVRKKDEKETPEL